MYFNLWWADILAKCHYTSSARPFAQAKDSGPAVRDGVVRGRCLVAPTSHADHKLLAKAQENPRYYYQLTKEEQQRHQMVSRKGDA